MFRSSPRNTAVNVWALLSAPDTSASLVYVLGLVRERLNPRRCSRPVEKVFLTRKERPVSGDRLLLLLLPFFCFGCESARGSLGVGSNGVRSVFCSGAAEAVNPLRPMSCHGCSMGLKKLWSAFWGPPTTVTGVSTSLSSSMVSSSPSRTRVCHLGALKGASSGGVVLGEAVAVRAVLVLFRVEGIGGELGAPLADAL